jgi:hypothetical protein
LGKLRTSRQVAIDATGPDLTVISDRPGVVGEELTLDLVQGGDRAVVTVRVIATQLQVVNGAVHHRLKLQVLDPQSDPGEARWTR